MPRRIQQSACRGRFNYLAGIHDGCMIGSFGHYSQIMRDKQNREATGFSLGIEKFQYLRLNGDV
jgi:hypothetical protein